MFIACHSTKLHQFLCNIKLFNLLTYYSVSFPSRELVDTSRKALIWRVVELTDDRSDLKLEVSSLQETVSRLEGRVKEKEEENKRYQFLPQIFPWFVYSLTFFGQICIYFTI